MTTVGIILFVIVIGYLLVCTLFMSAKELAGVFMLALVLGALYAPFFGPYTALAVLVTFIIMIILGAIFYRD